jgi:hypothetical protein
MGIFEAKVDTHSHRHGQAVGQTTWPDGIL